jgi:levoglucosan dehydrogenase
MYRAAAAAGVVHAVNFNYRKVHAVRFMARLLRERRVGEVRQFRGIFLQDWGIEARLPRSWKFAAAGAGALAGLGSHVIDLARHPVGEV